MTLTAHITDKDGQKAEAKLLCVRIRALGGRPDESAPLSSLKKLYSKMIADAMNERKSTIIDKLFGKDEKPETKVEVKPATVSVESKPAKKKAKSKRK